MVKPLSFKGDAKSKKRKRALADAPEPSTKSQSLSHTLEPRSRSTQASTRDDELLEDDTWIPLDSSSPPLGPLLLTFPTSHPSTLACDANGKIFTIPVENMIEGAVKTAEPHDVRQVWVGGKVAGMEGITLKGSNSRFLSLGKYGAVAAGGTAVGGGEIFEFVPYQVQGGTEEKDQEGKSESEVKKEEVGAEHLVEREIEEGAFSLKTSSGTYLSVSLVGAKGSAIRGDAEKQDETTKVYVKMQARFRPKTKEAGKVEKDSSAKISRSELEKMVGRQLEDEEYRKLKRARKEGDLHERVLDVRAKGKHDKFA